MKPVTRRSALASFGMTPLAAAVQPKQRFPKIPADYLREAPDIPAFWVGSVPEVGRFLDTKVRKGKVQTIGTTAGKRPMRAVFYGQPRAGKGTTTFSGSLGFGDVRAYYGPDHTRKVYFGFAGVHGGEFEGMVGMVNLISVLETGADLRGKAWPRIASAAAALDRVILLPITNLDGRARIPLRLIAHRGTDHTVHEYLNTGGKPDGKIIGWPQCKEFIPLDFSTTGFPGGYPNDAGVNIQHDDFLGARQPETQALLNLAARERPDLTINMHTGATFIHPLRSQIEPALGPVFDKAYARIMTALTEAGLQQTGDAAKEANPARERVSPGNLETALNLHCGSLSMLVESPSHNFSTAKKNGQPFFHTPDLLVDAQLVCHQEAMQFLAETGGRWKWAKTARG
jgi:hypothetical protein